VLVAAHFAGGALVGAEKYVILEVAHTVLHNGANVTKVGAGGTAGLAL
jgi:hypothetical protein